MMGLYDAMICDGTCADLVNAEDGATSVFSGPTGFLRSIKRSAEEKRQSNARSNDEDEEIDPFDAHLLLLHT